MALLYSCWIIIETILIPNGPRKWVLLGFYIKPILILFCQLFLFGKWIGLSMFLLLCSIVRELRYLGVEGFRLIRYSVFQLVVIMELDDDSIIRLFNVEDPRERWLDFLETKEDDEEEDLSRSILLYNASRIPPVMVSSMVPIGFPSDFGYREEVEIEELKSMDEHHFQPAVVPEHLRHKQRENQHQQQQEEDEKVEDFKDLEVVYTGNDEKVKFFEGSKEEEESKETKNENFEEEEEEEEDSSEGDLGSEDQDSESSYLNEEITVNAISEIRREETITEPETDEFYKDYKQRMKLFDQRLSDGICAVRSLMRRDISTLTLSELESVRNRIDSLSDVWQREILKCLFYDFEMIYVGQSCLSWEALHHQYRKVQALSYSPDSHRRVFSCAVASRFQQFQISIQRFTENCSGGGNRFLSYIQSRSSNGFLLQVPNVSDYLVEAHDGYKNEEVILARDLLGRIKRTIVYFNDFLEKDKGNKPPLMKLKKIFLLDSQVDNPNDLESLATLNREISKKETVLKDLQRGSWRWWRKKKRLSLSSLVEDEKEVVMFSMIETKLVSRVLKMSKISTEQLMWCEGKLNGVQVKKGVVTMTSDVSLFPYS